MQYREALRLRPDYAQAHNNLSGILLQRGELAEAVSHIAEARRLDPANVEAQKQRRAGRSSRRAGCAGKRRHRSRRQRRPHGGSCRARRTVDGLQASDSGSRGSRLRSTDS